MPKISAASESFQAGQVWKLADSNLHIALVGRSLVHYKHLKTNVKRAPISLIVKADLEAYLKKNNAVLVQNQK